jgi:hypothetical protein
MTIEGGTSHLHATTHFSIEPLLIDFGKGNSLCLMNGIHQPYVFLEFCIGSHRHSFYCHKNNKKTAHYLFLGEKTIEKTKKIAVAMHKTVVAG